MIILEDWVVSSVVWGGEIKVNIVGKYFCYTSAIGNWRESKLHELAS